MLRLLRSSAPSSRRTGEAGLRQRPCRCLIDGTQEEGSSRRGEEVGAKGRRVIGAPGIRLIKVPGSRVSTESPSRNTTKKNEFGDSGTPTNSQH
jgi:hypothetical protein